MHDYYRIFFFIQNLPLFKSLNFGLELFLSLMFLLHTVCYFNLLRSFELHNCIYKKQIYTYYTIWSHSILTWLQLQLQLCCPQFVAVKKVLKKFTSLHNLPGACLIHRKVRVICFALPVLHLKGRTNTLWLNILFIYFLKTQVRAGAAHFFTAPAPVKKGCSGSTTLPTVYENMLRKSTVTKDAPDTEFTGLITD